MENQPLNLNNIDIPNFDPSSLNKGQEMIFTLKDTNVLDNDNNNIEGKDNLQIEEVKYDKNTGICIERINENEFLEAKKEKNDMEIKDDGQIIDESAFLDKINKIKNKIEKKGESLLKKKKFQEEFYNEEELKLLNKKKKRKKNENMVLFDIDINDEENKDDDNKSVKKENVKIDKNNFENPKKSIFTSEDKELLENLFGNKKNKKETKIKKNIINIDENYSEEENNINGNNNDNIRINTTKNCKILDDYAIFLDNLPNLKNNEESNKKELNDDIKEDIGSDINNKNKNDTLIETNNILNENNSENKEKKENKENKENEGIDDELTFKQDDNIPLIEDEPIIGKGVCVALQIFKNKKMLREEEFGRYHDKKYENITNGVNEENGNEYDNNTLNIKDKNEYYKHKEINIEYRDENGRKLRPKEMARYQALIFHGSQSSVRKREKKLLREKYQVFVQNPANNKTLNYMNYMKDKNNQAFATLQGKSTFL